MYERIHYATKDNPREAGSEKRVVVYRAGALGDMITSFPVLANLRAEYPNSHITLIDSPEVSGLALSSNLVDRVVSSDSAWIGQWHMGNSYAVADALGRIDIAILYTRDPKNSLSDTLRALNIERNVVHPPLPPYDMSCHVTDFALRALDPLCVPVVTRTPTVLPDTTLLHNESFDRQYLFAHPGSSSALRMWPELVDCATEIASEYALGLVVNRGPVEAERNLGDYCNIDTQIVGPFDVRTLAAVISQASIFIGNDTGPTHLAAALGVPTIAVFGPHSNPVQWAPRGPRVEVAYREGRWPTRDDVRGAVVRLNQ